MTITSCQNCHDRHEKCHAHCVEYQTQKILKILVEAQEYKENKVKQSIASQKQRQVEKAMHLNHRRRRT